MSITSVTYKGIVGQQTFVCPFPVPETTDLAVTVNGVTAPFTLVADQVRLNTAVATDGHPVVITSEFAAISFTDSTANQAANATLTGKARDGWSMQEPGQFAEYFNATAYSSHASATNGFRIESSVDKTTWRVEAQTDVAAATPVTLSVPITVRYYRVIFANGATLTTAFRVTSSFTRS